MLSLVWAEDDSGADSRKTLAIWMAKAEARLIGKLLMTKMLVLPGFEVQKVEEPKKSPQFDEADFVLTLPSAAGHLPIRQSTLDEYGKKFHHLTLQFESAVRDHNAKHNPSGQSYKGEKKRTLEEATEGPGEEIAAHIGDKASLETPLLECAGRCPQMFELVVAKDKHLYLVAKQDGTVSSLMALTLIYGEFRTAAECEPYTSGRKKCSFFSWQMASMDYQASFVVDDGKFTPSFPEAPAKLADFLTFLEQNKIVDPTIVCHNLQADDGGAMVVQSNSPCLFEPLPLPPKTVPNWTNLGSCLDLKEFDAQTWVHSAGHLQLLLRLRYADNAQACGIFPHKMGVFLKKALKIRANAVYKLT